MSKGKSIILGVIVLSLTALILIITVNTNDRKRIHTVKSHSPMEKVIKEKSMVNFPEKEKVLKTAPNEKQKTEPPQDTYETKYIAISELNVRSGPGLEHNVIGVLTMNETIEAAAGNSTNGWVKINDDDLQGYVNENYLSVEKIKVVSTTAKNGESTNKTNGSEQKKDKEDTAKQNDSTQQDDTNQKSDTNTKKQKETAPKNDAQQLNTVGANNQLILVTTKGYGTSTATVQTFERNTEGTWEQILSIPGHIGKNGFAVNKQEGDGKSPTGKYSIGSAFGRSGDPGTKLPFRGITPDDVWVDDPDSKLYNTWQSRQKTKNQWNSVENMNIPAYTYGFVINYNTQRTPGAGSAIFFHISNTYTLGCTGVSQSNVVKILRWLDPAQNPVIIQTPRSKLGNY